MAAAKEPRSMAAAKEPRVMAAAKDRGNGVDRAANHVNGAVIGESVEHARVGEMLKHSIIVEMARDEVPRQPAIGGKRKAPQSLHC